MEDAATAEISRAQLWQWTRYGAVMANGTRITLDLIDKASAQVLARMKDRLGENVFRSGKYELAAKIFREMTASEKFPEFLTVPAYDYLA